VETGIQTGDAGAQAGKPARARTAGIGRFYMWNGGSLLIGQSTGATGVHAHHAVQIALTNGRALHFRSAEGDWTEYRGAVITPDLWFLLFLSVFSVRRCSVFSVAVDRR
jgi:hypothetical protein